MKGLLLAGGRGTRMQPLTYTNNKHAIPIANKPLIQYPFEMIVDAGIKEIGVIVNETRPEIEAILGDGSKWGAKITYIFQDHPGGLAHALSLSEEFMGDDKFVMVLGDNILEKGIKKYVQNFEKSDSQGHILGIKVDPEEHKRFGTATIDKEGKVLAYLEKPGVVDISDIYDPGNSYVVPGFYFAGPEIWGCFHAKDKIRPSSRGELEIPHAFNWLLSHAHKVTLDVVKGWYKDPGNPNDTLITNQVILDSLVKFKVDGDIGEESQVHGKVRIEKGAKVRNSILRGPIVIGKDCEIENAYIGPYSSISDGAKVSNCEISNSILMRGANVHDLEKRLDSCLIGAEAEVTDKKMKPKATRLFIGDKSVVEL